MSGAEGQAADRGGSAPEIPPLPWHLTGVTRLGLFQLAEPAEVPGAVTAIGARRLFVVATQVQGGDLRYNSMGTATLARRGRSIGLILHQMWIDEPPVRHAALKSARTPTDPAVFTWNGSSASITSEGRSVGLSWRPRTRLALPLPIAYTYFVWDNGRLGSVPIPGRAAVSPITMRVSDWPERFPALARYDTSLAVRLEFSITARPPRMLDK